MSGTATISAKSAAQAANYNSNEIEPDPDKVIGFEMTLRDYFAGQALIAAFHFGVTKNLNESDIAEGVWAMADAMIAAREASK